MPKASDSKAATTTAAPIAQETPNSASSNHRPQAQDQEQQQQKRPDQMNESPEVSERQQQRRPEVAASDPKSEAKDKNIDNQQNASTLSEEAAAADSSASSSSDPKQEGKGEKVKQFSEKSLKELADYYLNLEPADIPDTGFVVTGIAGRFPNADNLNELWDNLLNGKDMVLGPDDKRWPLGKRHLFLFQLDLRNQKLTPISPLTQTNTFRPLGFAKKGRPNQGHLSLRQRVLWDRKRERRLH